MWKTPEKCGKLQKNVGNMWETCGKHVGNMWETCGKLPQKCGKLCGYANMQICEYANM